MPHLITNANVAPPLRKSAARFVLLHLTIYLSMRPKMRQGGVQSPDSSGSGRRSGGCAPRYGPRRAGEWEVASHDIEIVSYYITLRASSTLRLGPNFRQSRLSGCGHGLCRLVLHLPTRGLRSLTTVSSPPRIARVSSPMVAMGCHRLPAMVGAVRTLIETSPTLLFEGCGYLVEAKGARSVATKTWRQGNTPSP